MFESLILRFIVFLYIFFRVMIVREVELIVEVECKVEFLGDEYFFKVLEVIMIINLRYNVL